MLTVVFKIAVLGMLALEMPAKKMFEPIFGPEDPVSMTAKAPETATQDGSKTASANGAEDEPMLMDFALAASEAHAQATPPAGNAPAAPDAQNSNPFNGNTLNTEEDLARQAPGTERTGKIPG